jgi:hypothetical protein
VVVAADRSRTARVVNFILVDFYLVYGLDCKRLGGFGKRNN